MQRSTGRRPATVPAGAGRRRNRPSRPSGVGDTRTDRTARRRPPPGSAPEWASTTSCGWSVSSAAQSRKLDRNPCDTCPVASAGPTGPCCSAAWPRAVGSTTRPAAELSWLAQHRHRPHLHSGSRLRRWHPECRQRCGRWLPPRPQGSSSLLDRLGGPIARLVEDGSATGAATGGVMAAVSPSSTSTASCLRAGTAPEAASGRSRGVAAVQKPPSPLTSCWSRHRARRTMSTFSSSVYPGASRISSRSRRGAGIPARSLAVAMNKTSDRSTVASR